MEWLAWAARRAVPVHSFPFLPTPTLREGGVVVIGCDSGMGRAAAERIAKETSLRIYAGCLTSKGVEELKSIAHDAFQIDVTDQASVDAAVALLAAREPNGLVTVCNVAGAMMGGPIEWTPMDTFRKEMELNYFGLLRVARAFTPLLRKWERGGARFVAVTSMIALMPSFPGLGGYAASKAAADSLMNTLRSELAAFGVSVININPGITKTPFLTGGPSNQAKAWDAASPDVRAAYGDPYAKWWSETIQFGIDWLAQSPDDAIGCVFDACCCSWPKTRYFAGFDARVLGRGVVHVPDFLWDFGLAVILLGKGRPSPATRTSL